MNERIEELAVLASKDNSDGYPVTLEYSNQFAEKFAELIINECCFKLLMMDAKAQGTHNYYKHAALELKRNFTEKL
jgi:roadblock/LC7 domain-containing protein